MTDPLDVLAGMDAARPLPAELRARLEERLLDAPARPLSSAQRARLSDSLVRRRRAPWLAAAAAAVLVVAGTAVLLQPDHPGTPTASRPEAARAVTATPAPSPAKDAVVTGSARGAGTTGGAGTVVGAPSGAGAEAPAAVPPGELRVLPASGPAAGGTTVRLTGPDLGTAVEVRFADRPATHLVVHSDGSVTVRSPAGRRGTSVDVTAVLRDGRRLVAAASFRYR